MHLFHGVSGTAWMESALGMMPCIQAMQIDGLMIDVAC